MPPPHNNFNSLDGSRGYNSNISKHQATSVEDKLNSKIDFVRKHAYQGEHSKDEAGDDFNGNISLKKDSIKAAARGRNSATASPATRS